MEGNFLESVPSVHADVVTLSHIIHGWNEEQALRNARAVRSPGDRLILPESVLPAGDEPSVFYQCRSRVSDKPSSSRPDWNRARADATEHRGVGNEMETPSMTVSQNISRTTRGFMLVNGWQWESGHSTHPHGWQSERGSCELMRSLRVS